MKQERNEEEKNIWRRRTNWDIKNSWFNWKYTIALKNGVEESLSREFKLKTVDETRNYLLEEIEQNELMSRKHKKICINLNHMEHILILASRITGCISISAFVSMLEIL